MWPKRYPMACLLFLALTPPLLSGQVPWEKLAIADSLYQAEAYEPALEHYEPVLKYYSEKKALIKAARCAALLKNEPVALRYLKRAAKLGLSNARVLQSDTKLATLRENPGFLKLLADVEEFETRAKNLGSPELLSKLDSIYADYQKYRGRKPDEAAQAKLDSLNLQRIEQLIAQHGWLGSNLLTGRNYCWLVIQHQPLAVQKKYHGLMAKAVKKGEEDPAFLASLEDRMQVSQGKAQRYGTQVDLTERRIYPIKNPEKVDFYRAKVGLGSIEALRKKFETD